MAASLDLLREHPRRILVRRGHALLGFDAGVDPYGPERDACWNAGREEPAPLRVRPEAATLLRADLAREGFRPQAVVLGASADPYPPIEQRLALTRACLQVFLEARQPVVVVTASQLVLRDLDLLRALARERCVLVAVALGTLDARRAARLEPGSSTPAERLHAIHRLSEAGVPVGLLLAPVVPGLTDEEVPAIVAQAAAAGATFARHGLLRLEPEAQVAFLRVVAQAEPGRRERVAVRLAAVAADGGRGARPGPCAQQVEDLVARALDRAGLRADLPHLSAEAFRPPAPRAGPLF